MLKHHFSTQLFFVRVLSLVLLLGQRFRPLQQVLHRLSGRPALYIITHGAATAIIPSHEHTSQYSSLRLHGAPGHGLQNQFPFFAALGLGQPASAIDANR